VRIPSRSGLPRDEVLEIQRSRLLAGAVGAIDEHGYMAATVAQIAGRARVSRRTFYELFVDREACLVALLEDVYALVCDDLRAADLEQLPWCERVRGGLLTILSFLDHEPALARVCVVQALRGGPAVLAQREAILTRLAGVLDKGREQSSRANDCTPLTAEGLVGAAFGIVHARLARGEAERLVDLLGELMAMIVLPYQGQAAARREQALPMPASMPSTRRTPALAVGERDPLQQVPMRVTYRTAKVLHGIAERPGISNREIADYAGIHDQGQISKLLARLQRLGLAANQDGKRQKGEPNAWSLTPLGERIAQRLNVNADK
jgi:AcrR family transcriptional regulator/DNA-binding MarR family transcriptional regulator